jgi:hypothetical protein
MAEQRLTQQVLEVLTTTTPAARLTQQVVEVLTTEGAGPPPVTERPVIAVIS